MEFVSMLHTILFVLLVISTSTRQFTVDAESSCVEGDDTCLLNPDHGTRKYYSDKERQNEVDISKTSYISQSGGIHDRYEYLDSDDSCVDSDPKCVSWAASGECTTNPKFMRKNCQFSCDSCSENEEEDVDSKVVEEGRGIEVNFDFGLQFGVEQICNGDTAAEVKRIVEETEKYWEDVDDMIRPLCKNEHAMCSYWAFVGECEKNLNYMSNNCGPACRKCH